LDLLIESVPPLTATGRRCSLKRRNAFFKKSISIACWPILRSSSEIRYRISELERKIGQQAMEIDFLKKALRRFREQRLPVAVNGGTDSMSKSKRRPKRGQS